MRTSSNVLMDFIQNIPEICIPPRNPKHDIQNIILENIKGMKKTEDPESLKSFVRHTTMLATQIQADDPEVWKMLAELEMQAEGLEA